MTFLRRITIVLLVACVAALSCKKAKGPANGKSVQPNNNLDSTVTMDALVNGVKWQSDSAFGYFVTSSTNDSGRVNLMIIATKKDPQKPTTFTFIINNFTGVNTYPVLPPENTAEYYVGNTRHYATVGSISITSDTAYSLKGTFNFVADTITVANGIFDVAIP